MHRRDFLKRSAAAAGLTPFVLGGAASASASHPFDVSLAEWSLVRELRSGSIDHLDFAQTARALGIQGVEYVNQFFFDRAEDAGYLREMKTRADGEGVRSLILMCDNEGRLGAPEPGERLKAVENHFKWVDAARALGCHSVRVNAYGEGAWDEQSKYAADGLRRLTAFADERDVNVLVENHGGLSSEPDWLVRVVQLVDNSRFGLLPDFGNFRIDEGRSYDSYEGIRALMPHALGVSAKPQVWDHENRQSEIDLARMMRIVLDAGYRGYVGIEYPGMEQVRAGHAALRALQQQFAAAY